MAGTAQVRIDDKVKLKSDVLFQHNPYAPMSEAELLAKLDDAIDDMENGRVQTLDEAWEEIDAV